jgi:hypothetical protein
MSWGEKKKGFGHWGNGTKPQNGAKSSNLISRRGITFGMVLNARTSTPKTVDDAGQTLTTYTGKFAALTGAIGSFALVGFAGGPFPVV